MAITDDLWEGARVSFTSTGTDAKTGVITYLNGGQAIVQPDGHSMQVTLEIPRANLQVLPLEAELNRPRKERFPYLGG
jgi:hypothetical protein